MQQKCLTAEIMSKNKKSYFKQQPALFSEISYSHVREINYLCDLEQKKKTINFPIFEFEKQMQEQGRNNGLQAITTTMYRKIMQNGYIEQKKALSKKKKKNKNPFEYDYEDQFINDDQLMVPKKNIEFKLENFKSLNYNMEEFYNSEEYKENLTQIEELNKKKNNQILIEPEALEAIRKQIKQNIHNKIGNFTNQNHIITNQDKIKQKNQDKIKQKNQDKIKQTKTEVENNENQHPLKMYIPNLQMVEQNNKQLIIQCIHEVKMSQQNVDVQEIERLSLMQQVFQQQKQEQNPKQIQQIHQNEEKKQKIKKIAKTKSLKKVQNTIKSKNIKVKEKKVFVKVID